MRLAIFHFSGITHFNFRNHWRATRKGQRSSFDTDSYFETLKVLGLASRRIRGPISLYVCTITDINGFHSFRELPGGLEA